MRVERDISTYTPEKIKVAKKIDEIGAKGFETVEEVAEGLDMDKEDVRIYIQELYEEGMIVDHPSGGTRLRAHKLRHERWNEIRERIIEVPKQQDKESKPGPQVVTLHSKGRSKEEINAIVEAYSRGLAQILRLLGA